MSIKTMPDQPAHYEVDKSSVIPIYHQLANWMEAKITTGEWPSYYRLPGEIDLARQLGVARGSLRKAIALLIQKRLLAQVHGKGTFVLPYILETTWTGNLNHVSEELMLMGIPFTTHVVEKKILPADASIAQFLEIEPDEAVFFLRRLRRVNEHPLVLHDSYFSAARYGDLISADFSEKSLYELIEEMYPIRLEWVANTIAVVRAGSWLAGLLEINIGEPVLLYEQIIYDGNDEKVAYSRNWFRSDRYRLKTVIRRGQNEDFYTALRHLASKEGEGIKIQPETDIGEVSAKKAINGVKSDRAALYVQQAARKETGLAAGRKLHLVDLLSPERIGIKVQVGDWQEAIRAVGALMVATGVVEERYVDAMVRAAKQTKPAIIAPGVAMTHAGIDSGVLKPSLALITLASPIRFGKYGGEDISVLLAISAVDTVRHVDALLEIAGILLINENLRAIKKAKTKEEILKVLSLTSQEIRLA